MSVGRQVSLTTIRGGINRLRIKGGAQSNVLYDLVNGYVTKQGTIRVRPGTTRQTELPIGTNGTVGLVPYNGLLATFSNVVTTVPSGFVCYVLTNPNNISDQLATIHFGQSFLGFLYVVAEFASGDIFHFWLQNSGAWKATTDYLIGTVITPTVVNGLSYVAQRDSTPNPTWAPNTPEAMGNIVEPTTYNGFEYTASAVSGSNPHTGATEPAWIASDGALVIEQADADLSSAPTVTPNPTNVLPTSVTSRYGNPASGS
jgi:hypothetical protein